MMTLRQSSNRLLQFISSRPASATPRDQDREREQRWAGWIERMAAGDIDALSSLYDESSRVIFTLVLEILHDRAEAEDALVAIYNEARLKARKFRARRQSPLNWLIEIARDLALQRLRASPDQPAEPPQDIFQHKRHAAAFALAKLSDEQRSILEMTYLCGLSAAEVAAILGSPEEHVRQQIAAGMSKLRGAASPAAGAVYDRTHFFESTKNTRS